MKIGFTGSRGGLSPDQTYKIVEVLSNCNPSEVHHGDCVGADEQFHNICRDLNIPIIIHPPTNESKRAFCEGGSLQKAKFSYLKRNQNIVDCCDLLIACPETATEKLRSGTWSTIRYARKNYKENLLLAKK